MATYFNMDHLRFLLRDVHGLKDVLQQSRYADYDEESVDIILQSARDFADRELFPFFTEMDRVGATYENGRVTAHDQLERVFRVAGENGWISPYFDYDEGGSQMPYLVYSALSHILEAANNSASGYLELASGAANLIRSFGDAELFEAYVPKMLSGTWGGTMALTEPQAGSSLSDIAAVARPTSEGHYMIEGQKIFISAGDHQGVENIVHLTLARIEGAPAGTKGISLFVVPKYRRDEAGALVDNDVITAGEFDKMGQKGYVTTHLVYGENANCRGWLVGEANLGLKYMFQMMNGARIAVGLTASSTATAAYYASLQYAKERPQGRKLNRTGRKDVDEAQTLIINHPDVRRMLLLQKAVVEGSLSLIMECARLRDMSVYGDVEADSERANDLLELLTPIAKTYPSEMGREAINNGLQILGGYGYTTDFPLEQYYRDIRIMTIYEGTTGIQSLDLLGRKITMNHGRSVQYLVEAMSDTIRAARTFDDLKPYAAVLEQKIGLTQQVLQFLLGFALEKDYERFLSDATIFMEHAGVLVLAWQWLKMATRAREILVTNAATLAEEFYENQVHTMRFYYKYEVPKMDGFAQTLMHDDVLTIATQAERVFA